MRKLHTNYANRLDIVEIVVFVRLISSSFSLKVATSTLAFFSGMTCTIRRFILHIRRCSGLLTAATFDWHFF